jgi:Flp pilus assembly protein TadD
MRGLEVFIQSSLTKRRLAYRRADGSIAQNLAPRKENVLIRDRFGSAATIALLVVALGACSTVNSVPPLQTDARTGGKATADYDSLLRVAATMRQAGDFAGAVGVYRQASVLAPQRTEPLVLLGATLFDMGQYNEASNAYEAALRLEPHDSEALVGQAKALLQSDRPQLAIGPLQRELAVHPDNVKALTVLGVAQDLTDDHEQAQQTYRNALARSPLNPALTGDLALSLAIVGRTDEALQLLKPLAAGLDATPRLRQNLALVYGLAGDREAAARTARLDLDEDAVNHNLNYYETLRSLPPAARTRAILAAPPGSRAMAPAAGTDPQR